MDLSTYRGQAVVVALDLESSSGDSGRLVVDEISLGGAAPGVRQDFLPVLGRRHRWMETGYLPLLLRAD
jgi:hypothetical protein